MRLWNHYHAPSSVDEALGLLSRYEGKGRIVGGGTDLLVEMKEGFHHPHEALIDITRISEMANIEVDDQFITIGAGVTHGRIVKSDLLAQEATCLVESCGVVGGPQVRNVGTLGGNVAHALPAGDGTVSLVALDAQVEVIHQGERKWLPITQLFVGPGQSLLDSYRDLLLRFRIQRRGANEGAAFKRVMRPQGVALPILGCASWVKLSDDGQKFVASRIYIAPTGPRPERASLIEMALLQQPANAETIDRAPNWHMMY